MCSKKKKVYCGSNEKRKSTRTRFPQIIIYKMIFFIYMKKIIIVDCCLFLSASHICVCDKILPAAVAAGSSLVVLAKIYYKKKINLFLNKNKTTHTHTTHSLLKCAFFRTITELSHDNTNQLVDPGEYYQKELFSLSLSLSFDSTTIESSAWSSGRIIIISFTSSAFLSLFKK